MRSALWFMVIFVVAVAAALLVELNQSHVVWFYPPYRFDVSLNLFLVGALALFLLLYGVLRVVLSIFSMPARAAQYRRTVRMQRAHNALKDGVFNLFAGRFSRAERAAKSAQVWPDLKEPAALLAARSAHRMQEYRRRDAWLAQITSHEGNQAKWVAMAEMQMDARDAEAALSTIAQLQAHGARQIHLQRIALRAHQHLQHWGEVLRIVRILEKRKALHPVVAAKLKQTACERQLASKANEVTSLLSFWHSLSSAERHTPKIAEQTARHLIRCGRVQEAQKILEEALKTEWDAGLVRCYGECVDVQRNISALPMIQQAEIWLKQKPADSALHYALGRLCQHQQLWGKAQASLEASLRYATHPAAQARSHLALAQLLEQLERGEAAQTHYRQAALLSNSP